MALTNGETMTTHRHETTDGMTKHLLAWQQNIGNALSELPPKDQEEVYRSELSLLHGVYEGVRQKAAEPHVRRDVAAELASDDGPLVDKIADGVTEIVAIHGDSRVADTLTFNIHRAVAEAAVTERLKQV